MCGITGIFAYNQIGGFYMINLAKSIDRLAKRGPDSRGSYIGDNIGLGHRRLSIIDTSYHANQPMTDESGRYTIVFNGEIFNYKALKSELINKGVLFFSESDTEVLLRLYILKGPACLDELVGFFAFAIYDKEENSLFIARDRMGIKPLLYFADEDKFIFSSEMKALLAFNVDKELDYVSLHQYLQFNYVPGPSSIYKNIKKLEPGHYIIVKNKTFELKSYFNIAIPSFNQKKIWDFEKQKQALRTHLDEAVKIRLNADVPVGAFLSGGIDSSIIVAVASQHTNNLNTFSIGYKDEPFFDETHYAKLVAEKFKTNHTVFSLSNDDLIEHLFEMLEYIDEPFGDSSSLPSFILCKKTAAKVKVALSGDGADEIFAGYNKHKAEFNALYNPTLSSITKFLDPIVKSLPKSRNSFFGNKVRQILRYVEGIRMKPEERYWRWCAYAQEDEALDLINKERLTENFSEDYLRRKEFSLRFFQQLSGINAVLRTDVEQVLVNDMLYKVDMMSMANGLEVRVPWLDHRVVNFAFSLPEEFKIDKNLRKRIVQETYREVLPKQLFNRSKKGFEVPLLSWLRNDLKYLIEKDLLEKDFIISQGVFNYEVVKRLKTKLFSSDPGDSASRIWGLLVFQYWWRKYKE